MKGILKRLFCKGASEKLIVPFKDSMGSTGRGYSTASAVGRMGEEAAVEFLKQKGYRIVKRNYRTREGEIDIVAHGADRVLFVEVKTRGRTSLGLPQEYVDRKKRGRIIKAAKRFLAESPQFKDFNVRFDVIAVTVEARRLVVEHLPDAFCVEE